MAVIVGVGIVVAASIGPRVTKWVRPDPPPNQLRLGGSAVPRTQDIQRPDLIKAVLQAQLRAGRERLAQEAELKAVAEDAETRATALRLYTDEWRLSVELALASDQGALEDFRRTVDTQQMHYIDAAPHTLRVLLERLRRIIGEPAASSARPTAENQPLPSVGRESDEALVRSLREREARLRTAVDTLVAWLYRRQNWPGLSRDARYSEPAPNEIWAIGKYRELGLTGIPYEPPPSVGAEPGFMVLEDGVPQDLPQDSDDARIHEKGKSQADQTKRGAADAENAPGPATLRSSIYYPGGFLTPPDRRP